MPALIVEAMGGHTVGASLWRKSGTSVRLVNALSRKGSAAAVLRTAMSNAARPPRPKG